MGQKELGIDLAQLTSKVLQFLFTMFTLSGMLGAKKQKFLVVSPRGMTLNRAPFTKPS